MPWGEVEDRLLVYRAKVKRGDFSTFLNFCRQFELTPAAPATRGCSLFVVNGGFGTDQDIGQLVIGRTPGAEHLRGGDVAAQHLLNGPQQAAADNRVVLREDLQCNMLVDDSGHQIAQLVELINMPCIHQYTVGQRSRLVATGLVGLVEQRAHLRVFREHHAIEVCDQPFTAAFQQWHGGFNDGTILSSKHKGDS